MANQYISDNVYKYNRNKFNLANPNKYDPAVSGTSAEAIKKIRENNSKLDQLKNKKSVNTFESLFNTLYGAGKQITSDVSNEVRSLMIKTDIFNSKINRSSKPIINEESKTSISGAV